MAVNPELVMWWCCKCNQPVQHSRVTKIDKPNHERVLIECHGSIICVEKNFELEKHDPPPLVLAQRNLASAYAGPFKVVFKPDDKERDVCVMMKNMMQLLGFTSAVAITSSRFARMEERQLTNEFKLRGFPYPFNLGIACELHPWLDIRIFYQHGPADDKEYIGIGSSRVKRDVMYRNHIERLKYGDLSEWPPRYREYFPKPS